MINTRFPGQWYQAESGLHQNWMRGYDPTTGRYIQADPLGLIDGPSVYNYALQNPGRYVDPREEKVTIMCRPLAGLAALSHMKHCAIIVETEKEKQSLVKAITADRLDRASHAELLKHEIANGQWETGSDAASQLIAIDHSQNDFTFTSLALVCRSYCLYQLGANQEALKDLDDAACRDSDRIWGTTMQVGALRKMIIN